VLKAVVGVGANLGDRLTTMRAAARELASVARVVATSRVYETAPVGPPQPDFLNAAVLVDWEWPPQELLRDLLAIEARLGRVRGTEQRWGPRVIDLDFLWAEGVALDDPRLTLPHPRLRDRAFALVPLLELVPDACDPRTGESYAEIVSLLMIAPSEVRPTGEVL
jgi:2-amino-4-hydroxy-6-hydroxymethyldihydropteridine diphosphokinase